MAVSLSVTLTVPAPASVTEALLVVAASVAVRPFSGPSTKSSSTAVTVMVTVSLSTASTANVPVLAVKSASVARVTLLIAVLRASVPVPLVLSARVAVRGAVAPPSATLAVPLRVTVAVSLSVTLTSGEPVELLVALVVVTGVAARPFSVPSTKSSSTAVTVMALVDPVSPAIQPTVVAVKSLVAEVMVASTGTANSGVPSPERLSVALIDPVAPPSVTVAVPT